MSEEQPLRAKRTPLQRWPVAPRYFVASGLFLFASASILLVLDRITSDPLPWPCWFCAQTLLIIATIMVLAIVQQGVFALASVKAIAHLDHQRSFYGVFEITLVGSMVNAVAPAKAGTVLRGLLFKKVFGISLEDFIGSQSLISILGLLIATIMAFAVSLHLSGIFEFLPIVIVGSLLLMIALVALRRFPSRLTSGPGLKGRIIAALHAAGKPLSIPKVRWWLIGTSLLQLLVVVFRVALSLFLVGAGLSIHAAFLIASAMMVAPLLAVLPGGAGTRELLFGAGALLAGISPELSLAAALLDRAMGTLALTVASVPAAWRLKARLMCHEV